MKQLFSSLLLFMWPWITWASDSVALNSHRFGCLSMTLATADVQRLPLASLPFCVGGANKPRTWLMTSSYFAEMVVLNPQGRMVNRSG